MVLSCVSNSFENCSIVPLAHRAAEPRLDEHSKQDLGSDVWVFATASQLGDALFAALATAADPRLDECNAVELANTAWVYAKVN